MEAGSNSFELAAIAEKLGVKSVILNSFAVGRISKSVCKNDKKDAIKLARVYFSGLADNVWQPDEITRVRREILSGYLQAVKDATRCCNRIKAYLTGRRIRLAKGMHLRKETTRKHIATCYDWSEDQMFLLKQMFRNYDSASEKRLEFHQHMGKTVLENPLMNRLMNLCGIRLISAYAIIAVIGDINRFDNPKKLTSYLGFAPAVRQSGSSSRNLGVRGSGRRDVKAVLAQAAHSILRSKNESGKKIREWGVKIKMRKNQHIAVCAIARKLAVAVWYAMKGYLPDILDAEAEIKRKLGRISLELGRDYIKETMGFKTVKEFTEKNMHAILFYKHQMRVKQ
jgi:transposase